MFLLRYGGLKGEWPMWQHSVAKMARTKVCGNTSQRKLEVNDSRQRAGWSPGQKDDVCVILFI